MTIEGNQKNNIPAISLAKITLLIAAFSLLSRLFGFLRDLILASSFGAGDLLDAYYAAFRVPDLLFNIFIIGTLTVSFLPIFNRELLKDFNRASKLANTVFTFATAGITALAVILIILANPLVSVIAPGFDQTQHELTVMLTRIMLLSPVFFTISNLTSVVLHSYHRFLPTAAAPILYNIGIILGAVVFFDYLGPAGLAVGVVFGAIMHAGLQSWSMRKLPLKIKASFDWHLDTLKEVWRMYVPRLLSLDNGQISLLIGSIIGSLLASGSIAIFTFANNIQSVPLGIFALSFAVASFPGLSKTWAVGKIMDFRRILTTTSIQILFFVLPLSAFIVLLRAQLVRILLGRGQFTWLDTILTAQTLGVLAISLFAQSLIPLFARAFYATYNTKTPVIIGLVSATINIVLAIPLSNQFGVVGIGLATTIASLINVSLLAIFLSKRIGKLLDFSFAESVLKILIATGFSSIVVYATLYAVAPALDMTRTLGVILQTTAAGITGFFTYLILGLLLNLPEARSFITTTRDWLGKFTRPLTVLISEDK